MKPGKMAAGFVLLLIFMIISVSVNAQKRVGIGTLSPDSSSILEINSNSKGILLPRLSVAQRNAISGPANGLLIYQTDVNPGFYYYDGGWQPLTPAISALANTSLSNLTATAINADLLPDVDGTRSLGSLTTAWGDVYFGGDVYLKGSPFLKIRGANSFIGAQAGNTGITGSYNTATGANALSAIITGNWNTANGYTALAAANNAYSNTAIGFQSLIVNTTGSYNTAAGVLALGSNTSGVSNSAMGTAALNNVSSGNYNAAIGYFSGANLASGNYNTYLGSYADGPTSTSISNATAIGYNAIVGASNSVRVGNTSVTSIGGQVNWSAFSDGRYKINVKDNVPGLLFINQLRPVTYNLDLERMDKKLRPTNTTARTTSPAVGKPKELTAAEIKERQANAAIQYSGFIAQEVEATANKLGYSFSGVDAPKNADSFYGLRYGDFVVPLVKAVQELSKENKELKDMLSKLQAQVDQLAKGK